MQIFPNRTIISLSGPDTLALLERTVTHTVGTWPVGEMRYGGLLTPQGKLIADYLALRTQDGVLLDTHEDAAADLAKRFKMFRLRSAVDIEILEGWGVFADEAGTPDPRAPDALPKRTIAKTPSDAEAIDWQAARLHAGIPDWGQDYRAAEVFPSDINMDHMGGVDYKKGCFVGQEVVSRMKRRGKIRKRTLVITGEALTTGADVHAGTVRLGQITSASDGKALALLRIDHLMKALGETTPITANDQTIDVTLPAWLAADMDAIT